MRPRWIRNEWDEAWGDQGRSTTEVATVQRVESKRIFFFPEAIETGAPPDENKS
jgi:hypothetical protein